MGLDFSKQVELILEGSWLEITSKTGSKYHKFSAVAKEYALYIASKLVPPDFDPKMLPKLAAAVGLLPTSKGAPIKAPGERHWRTDPHPKAGTVGEFDPLFDPYKDTSIDTTDPHRSLGTMAIESFPSEYYIPPGQDIPAKVSKKHNQLLFSIKTYKYDTLTKTQKQEVLNISIGGTQSSKAKIGKIQQGPKLSDIDDKLTEAILHEADDTDMPEQEFTMKLPDRHSEEQKRKKEEFLKQSAKLEKNLDKALDTSQDSSEEQADIEPIRRDTIYSRNDKYIIIGAQPTIDKRYTQSVTSITIDPNTFIDINYALVPQGQIKHLRDTDKISIKNIKLGHYEVWRIKNNTNEAITLDTEPIVIVSASQPAVVELSRVNVDDLTELNKVGIIDIEVKKEPIKHVNREREAEELLNSFTLGKDDKIKALKYKIKPASIKDIGATGDKMQTLTHFIIDFQQPIGEFTPSEEALAKDAEKLTPKQSADQPTDTEQFKTLYTKAKKKDKASDAPGLEDI